MNRWNIPRDLEKYTLQRDTKCIYCNIVFNKKNKKETATWEHIINNAKIINENNIALCCFSCNASKGAKDLSVWLNSEYCKEKNIKLNNFSPSVKQRLKNLFPDMLY